MASTYPGAFDTFPARVPNTPVAASHVNALQDAAVAIQATLGINPQGAAASVAARLANAHVLTVTADYGAVGDYNANAGTGTNSTAAFTNAVNQAAALLSTPYVSAVAIRVPAGNYLTEKLPPLPNRCALIGDGAGTSRLVRRNTGTLTGPFVTNATNARAVTVRGLTLDGGGVGDATSHGLLLDNTAAAGTDPTNGVAEYVDARHYCADLIIQAAKGDGHRVVGRGVTMVERVQVWICDGHGFNTGTDSFYSDCDAGSSGLDGFFIGNANTRLGQCKAWYSGRISTAGAGVTGGTGHGFHISDGNYSSNTLLGCEAQDNARAGYFLSNVGRQIVAGSIADSNNTANLGHAGFEVINSYENRVSGFAWDRAANTFHQLAGVRVSGGGENIVEVSSDYTTMTQAGVTTDSTVGTGVRLAIGAAGYAPNVGAYTGAVMNFPMATGDVFTGTLTQNTTVGFVSTVPGPSRKTFVMKQDATGSRTLAWPKPGAPTVAAPGVYWAGGTAPVMTTTANATDVFELVTYDGVRWYGTRLAANAS